MAAWNDLPKDIWWLVFKRLTLTDHVPFSGVCKLWRSMVMEYRSIKIPTRVPGLIVPASTSTDSQTRHFLAYPVGKNIDQEQDMPILSIPHQHLCGGSYQGWLVMVTNAMDMYLHNPLTGVRVGLPPVTTLPRPRPEDTLMSKWYIKKAILSASPSPQPASECLVVVFYGRGELAFCKIGDKSWNVIDCPNRSWFIDGIFYNDKFYLVDWSGSSYVFDLTNSDGPIVNEHAPPPPSYYLYAEKSYYLVELDGELFQVRRDVLTSGDEVLSNDEDDQDGQENELGNEEQVAEGGVAEVNEENLVEGANGTDDEFDDFDYDNKFTTSIRNYVDQTIRFSVFRLDKSGTESRWIQVKDLDGGAIFLGMNQSFAIISSDLVGYKGDRIYYTDDSMSGRKLYLVSGKDMGVFHVGDSSFEPLYITSSNSIKPHPVWITPMQW